MYSFLRSMEQPTMMGGSHPADVKTMNGDDERLRAVPIEDNPRLEVADQPFPLAKDDDSETVRPKDEPFILATDRGSEVRQRAAPRVEAAKHQDGQQRRDRPEASKKGGGGNQGGGNKKQRSNKDLTLTTEQLTEYVESGKTELNESESQPIGFLRRQLLEKRIAKGEALLEISQIKEKIDALRVEQQDLANRKNANDKARNQFRDFKKNGSKTIDSDEKTAENLKTRITELGALDNASEEVEIARLKAELENIEGIIERKRKAIESEDDWEDSFNEEMNSIETRRQVVAQELEVLRADLTDKTLAYPHDEFKDVSFIDDPRDRDSSPPIYLSDSEVHRPTSNKRNALKDTAVFAGGTVGAMIGNFFGGVGELWESFKGYMKSDSAFGGWDWKRFVFGDKSKKK